MVTHQSDMLEGEKALVSEVVRGLRFADDDDVLDADAVPPVGVVSGLYMVPSLTRCTYSDSAMTYRSRPSCLA